MITQDISIDTNILLRSFTVPVELNKTPNIGKSHPYLTVMLFIEPVNLDKTVLNSLILHIFINSI